MEKMSSPGFIEQIHPKLISLKSLKVALEVGMYSAKYDKERANKRWGAYHNKIEVTLPVIECAAKDGTYTKTVLSKAYEQGQIKVGKAIPQGYHCMEGEEAYKVQLRAHNKYVQSITVVTIVGLHPAALWTEI
eukprot:1127369-Ditylum_brightwellii.AAC.1